MDPSAPPLPAPSPGPAPAPAAEDFADVREALREQPKSASAVLVFLVSLGVFAVTSGTGGTALRDLSALVFVLLLHEVGHLAGMRLFGYSNLQILFIPFLGASASGRRRGAPGWQQAVVALLGPLPGIVLGVAFAFGAAILNSEFLRNMALWLLAINAFNLLPVLPFDGGRLFELVFFSRHPALETAFQLLAVGALALLAVDGIWILGVVALFLLMGLPMRRRESLAAHRLRKALGEYSADPSELDGVRLEALAAAAREVAPATGAQAETVRRAAMRNLHERLSRRAPGALASALLLLVYLGGVVASIFGFGLHSAALPSARAPVDVEHAKALFAQGRAAEAEQRLSGCWPNTPASEVGKATVFRCKSLLGRIQAAQGRHAEAEKTLTAALDAGRMTVGVSPLEYSEAAAALMAAQAAQGRRADGPPVRMEALPPDAGAAGQAGPGAEPEPRSEK